MLEITPIRHCNHCGNALAINKRKDALYCCAAHRAAQWRIEQIKEVSVKLRIPKPQFLSLKADADSNNLLINQHLLNQLELGAI